MNEITRIRIAKIAYDIDIDAKRALETYESALRTRLEDKSVLEDIEIRMCELLAARNVQAGGVITLEDVQALQNQLGDPSEFGDEQKVLADGSGKPTRKLYRDLDHAVLGGVLSGLATYFHSDATLFRIVFAVLLVGSFGTFSLVYMLLWALIPAAKTAAQKLELAGEPVTLANLQTIGEVKLSEGAIRLRRTFMRGFGVLSAGMALSILTWLIGVRLFIGNDMMWSSTRLVTATAAISGIVLFALAAYGLIRQTWRREFSTLLIGLAVLLGLLTMVAALMSAYAQSSISQGYETSTSQRVEHYSVAKEFAGVKRLVVDASATVVYSVGASSLSVAEANGLPHAPALVVNGDTATLVYNGTTGTSGIVLSGPELGSVEVKRGSFVYSGVSKSELLLKLDQSTDATLSGSLGALSVAVSGNGASLDAGQLSVDKVVVVKDDQNVGENSKARLNFASIGSLTVTYPKTCAEGTGLIIGTRAVSGSVTANAQPVRMPLATSCFELAGN